MVDAPPSIARATPCSATLRAAFVPPAAFRMVKSAHERAQQEPDCAYDRQGRKRLRFNVPADVAPAASTLFIDLLAQFRGFGANLACGSCMAAPARPAADLISPAVFA